MENLWDLCAKSREKETNTDHSQNFYEHEYCPTKNISYNIL